eukprot:CAMPEP_0115844280 /NCGR_PEP_ID=MMETSP0287-20121206/8750_1 /TAXON_ID=412157 /ORGANISM="Chrysochromulina rotalis, Strain UIO044" /LENGTH=242 /DNA_ID=CAMNT_0003298007 /DNA_START=176 /DNA_END=904 /DNA_ORIENTATION=-
MPAEFRKPWWSSTGRAAANNAWAQKRHSVGWTGGYRSLLRRWLSASDYQFSTVHRFDGLNSILCQGHPVKDCLKHSIRFRHGKDVVCGLHCVTEALTRQIDKMVMGMRIGSAPPAVECGSGAHPTVAEPKCKSTLDQRKRCKRTRLQARDGSCILVDENVECGGLALVEDVLRQPRDCIVGRYTSRCEECRELSKGSPKPARSGVAVHKCGALYGKPRILKCAQVLKIGEHLATANTEIVHA